MSSNLVHPVVRSVPTARSQQPRAALCAAALLALCGSTPAFASQVVGESPQINLNYVWVLVAAALVFLMQAGFMCVETGMARAKNSINIAIKNLADFMIAVVGFWAFGFGLMFGLSDNGIVGATDFFMEIGHDPWRAVFFVFQAMFVGTAATIDSGAVAERTTFIAYLIVSFTASCIIYPVFGHWAWGSLLHGAGAAGWLEGLGFHDFAGSTVVHSVGAWVALVGVWMIGPRRGKYNEDGTVNRIQPSNLQMVYLGTFILFFGWFGFNCGSTLEATDAVAGIAFNTMLAGAFGGIAATAACWIHSDNHLPEAECIANGVLGGLVGITAGCDIVDAYGAALIGSGAGLCVYFGGLFIERVLKLDDVVGAISVHGLSGAFGTLALALVAPELPEGTSRLGFLGVQAAGVGTCLLWTVLVTFIVLNITKLVTPIRVDEEAEHLGLNIAEHGASSSLLDLAVSMQRASAVERHSPGLKVEVEHGTTVGDLARCYNNLIDALCGAQERNDKALNSARLASESAQDALARLADEQQVRESEKEAYRTYFKSAVDSILDENHRMEELLTHSMDLAAKVASSVSSIEDRMSSLNLTFGEIGESTTLAARVAGEATQKSDGCQAVVGQLGKSVDRIGVVGQTISSIGQQTRLLALNAGVEAARTREGGGGLGVIAEKVRSLADDSDRHAATIQSQVLSVLDGTRSTAAAILDISKTVAYLNSVNGDVAKRITSGRDATSQIVKQVQVATESTAHVVDRMSGVRDGVQEVGRRVQDVYHQFVSMLASEKPQERPRQVRAVA